MNAGSRNSLSADQRHRLMLVIAINFGVFILELTSGDFGGSQALQADALDFFAFGLAAAMSLGTADLSPQFRAGAELARGVLLVLLGVWVAVSTLYAFFVSTLPVAEAMGAIGFVALAANLLSVYLLRPTGAEAVDLRALLLLTSPGNDDPVLRTTALNARNDIVGNVAVIIAALLVSWLQSAAPDRIVAGVMVVLYLAAAYPLLRQGWTGWQSFQADANRASDKSEQEL